jgi:hypothetical protein
MAISSEGVPVSLKCSQKIAKIFNQLINGGRDNHNPLLTSLDPVTKSVADDSGTKRPTDACTTPMHTPSLIITLIVSSEPTSMPRQHLTTRQSFAQIAHENQAVDEPVLSAWMQDTGGRTFNLAAPTITTQQTSEPCDVFLQDWVKQSCKEYFSATLPDHIAETVHIAEILTRETACQGQSGSWQCKLSPVGTHQPSHLHCVCAALAARGMHVHPGSRMEDWS